MRDWRHWAIFVLTAILIYLLCNDCSKVTLPHDTRVEDSLKSEIQCLQDERAQLRMQQTQLAGKSIVIEKKAKELPRVKDVAKPMEVILSQPIEETARDYDSLEKLATKKEKLLDESIAIADSARKTLATDQKIDSLEARLQKQLLAEKEAQLEKQKALTEEERKKGNKKAVRATIITAAVTIVVVTIVRFFRPNNAV